jgi:predicted MFS family arabinose efflux permease
MVASRAAAVIILSLVFGRLAVHFGYTAIFPIIAVGMLLPFLWASRIPMASRINDPASRFTWTAFSFLKSRRYLLFAAYVFVVSAASFGTDGLVTYYLRVAFDVSDDVIGQYGALRGSGAVVGALTAIIVLGRIGLTRSVYGATVALALVAALFGVIGGGETPVVWLGLIWGMAWSFQEAAMITLAMSISDPRTAASSFAVIMAVSNLGGCVGDGVAASLTDNLGFRSVFLGTTMVILLVVMPILWFLFPKGLSKGFKKESMRP